MGIAERFSNGIVLVSIGEKFVRYSPTVHGGVCADRDVDVVKNKRVDAALGGHLKTGSKWSLQTGQRRVAGTSGFLRFIEFLSTRFIGPLRKVFSFSSIDIQP